MKQIYQKKLHGVIAEIMSLDIENEDFKTYQSVISMIYSLIEDGHINRLDTVLRQNFPNYYNSPVPLTILDIEN